MLNVNKFIIFITTILALCDNLSANEISMKNTVDFIKSKMNTVTAMDNGEKYKVIQTFKQIENCQFSIIRKYSGMKKINDKKGEAYGALKEITIFNAKDLNPKTIE